MKCGKYKGQGSDLVFGGHGIVLEAELSHTVAGLGLLAHQREEAVTGCSLLS